MFIKSDVKSKENSTDYEHQEKDSELQTLFPFLSETKDWSEEKPSLTTNNYF